MAPPSDRRGPPRLLPDILGEPSTNTWSSETSNSSLFCEQSYHITFTYLMCNADLLSLDELGAAAPDDGVRELLPDGLVDGVALV